MTKFGGSWTESKLQVLEKYLHSYLRVMKNQPFRLIYIDPFAGGGESDIKDGTETDARKVIAGSPLLAVKAEKSGRSFDKFIFVDNSAKKIKELKKIMAPEMLERKSIQIIKEDANVALQKICEKTNWHGTWPECRAVLFLDPFATQVDWATIKAVAQTEAIDTWLLFPVGAISRLLPLARKPEEVSLKWSKKLDKIFGGDSWKEIYNPTPSLFNNEAETRKTGLRKILSTYKENLKNLFGDRFLDADKILKTESNVTLFHLMFLAGHPRGRGIAHDIAKHLIHKEEK